MTRESRKDPGVSSDQQDVVDPGRDRRLIADDRARGAQQPTLQAGVLEIVVAVRERGMRTECSGLDKGHLTNVEAFGGGTLAYDKVNDRVAPRIHVSVGLKEHSATGHTNHRLAATVQS